ncbi:MAG: hypothetical protein WBA97_17985 [Actinophytocola sp.]|uniref:hypothetical protein n=1 Tax=Actinophytocola sp. TaxID=1872138 RepID=UPI003C79396F
MADLAGFAGLETFTFDVDVPYPHAAWRGRVRSSNGVGASLPEDTVAAFDADLARLLRDRFGEEPLMVPHRVFAMIASVPLPDGDDRHARPGRRVVHRGEGGGRLVEPDDRADQ